MVGLGKNLSLIEEGFSDFFTTAAPPPRWHDRGFHQRAPSVAMEHQHAEPPTGEK
jgi:hypothetical protein